MKTTLVLFAVTMFTSMTITAANVPPREEQYRAKHGRYTPAFEAQRSANPATAPNEIATPDCCRSLRAERGQNAIAEEFKRVKYGRKSPAGAAQAWSARNEATVHGSACRTLQHCPLPLVTAAVVTPDADNNARLTAKFGRVYPAPQPAAAATPSRHAEPCEHACCQVAE